MTIFILYLQQIYYKMSRPYCQCFRNFKLITKEKICESVYGICSLLALLPLVTCGADMVWFSSAYSSIVSNNSDINPLDIPATTGEISVMAGLPVMIGLIGPIFMPKISNKIGRKFLLQIIALGLFLTNVALAFSTHAIYIIIGRCFIFICLNSYFIICQVYMCEVSQKNIKTRYLYVMMIMLPVGEIYGFFFGPMFHYRIFTLILVIPILPFFLFFIFAPESPVHLLSKGKTDEFIISLKKLQLEMELPSVNGTPQHKSILNLFENKETRIGILLAILLGVAPFACGISTIKTFLGPMLVDSGTKLTENTMTVSVGIVQIISTLWTYQMTDKVGRRTMLISSGIGCGLSLFTWGLYFYFKINHFSVLEYFQWVPLISAITSTILFSVGFGSLPTTIINEIFSSDILPTVISLSFFVSCLTVFIISSAYPFIVEAIGMSWCIWIFSLNCFISAFLIYLFLPETMGKSSEEVQEILKNY